MKLRLFLCFLMALSPLIPASAQDSKKKDVPKIKSRRITTVEGLRFSPVRFSAKRGEKMIIRLENRDPNDQPHNFVLIKPGALAEIQAASMAVGPDSVKNEYVPQHDAVLAASGLLNPEGKEELEITIPKEKGIYHYVCTFPGHAVVMYGAIYVDEKIRGSEAYDPNIPEIVRAAELEKIKAIMEPKRPSIQRLFMPKSGPAAIAVALPDAQNFCWDAGNCRLRFAWKGGFVDASRMFNSNGNSLGKLLGEEYWNSGGGENTYGIQIGEKASEAPDFKGYSLIDGVPEFEYTIDGATVRELVTSTKDGLNWRFKVENPSGDVRVYAPGNVKSETGKRDGDFWIFEKDAASEFTLNISTK